MAESKARHRGTGVVAIIPARSGSKGLPGKNLRRVGGLPLIAHAILLARSSREVERCVVSTDSEAIAEVARRYGAEVPFLRPAELAQDDTPGEEPVIHAVCWLAEHDHYCPGYVLLLQPTSPLRALEDITAAIHLARCKRADGVVSVACAKPHPYWTKVVADDGRVKSFLHANGAGLTRRQALPPVYAVNGAIYLAKRQVLLERRTWYTDKTYAYVMPPERSLDIDSAWDLHLADLVLRAAKRAR